MMKVKYRIGFRKSESQALIDVINEHNIRYNSLDMPNGNDPIISFDVYDTHVSWVKIWHLVNENKIPHLPTKVFSKKELHSAPWCRVGLTNHVGYPQPEDEWLSTRFTYEDYNPETRTFGRQINNFRIKREPRLGKRHFMDLTWPNELFAKKEVIATLEASNIKGYETWDVLIHRTGEPSREIVQLGIPYMTKAKARLEGHPTSLVKPTLKKYMPYTKGILVFSSELLAEDMDFLRSQEWFGDGNAFRQILVSQKVVKLILDNKWKGLSLEPVHIEGN